VGYREGEGLWGGVVGRGCGRRGGEDAWGLVSAAWVFACGGFLWGGRGFVCVCVRARVRVYMCVRV
jgi:hypothetical protein